MTVNDLIKLLEGLSNKDAPITIREFNEYYGKWDYSNIACIDYDDQENEYILIPKIGSED